jgi:hypothetical protein
VPQRNEKVDLQFQTLYGRILDMLNDSGIEVTFITV